MEPQETSLLIQRASEGDELAWNAIVDEFSVLVWSVVRRFRLREDLAADAVQTTWLRLVEHIGSIRDGARLAGWLRTTTHRICLGIVRDAGRERLVDPTDDPDRRPLGRLAEAVGEDDPEASAVRAEHRALIRAVVAQLPPKHRSLLTAL